MMWDWRYRRSLARYFRRLRRQHFTEWDFGWHDPSPKVRAACRRAFPVELVAEAHRKYAA